MNNQTTDQLFAAIVLYLIGYEPGDVLNAGSPSRWKVAVLGGPDTPQ